MDQFFERICPPPGTNSVGLFRGLQQGPGGGRVVDPLFVGYKMEFGGGFHRVATSWRST